MSNNKLGLMDEFIKPQYKENIIYDVPIELLEAYDDNEFDLTEIEYLSLDIKEYGQKTPIQVCIDKMQVIDGSQRYHAIKKTGMKTIKAIFKKYENDSDRKISHYKANEHRKNIKPSTLAKAVLDLSIDLEERGFNKSQINEHLGSHYGYADRSIRRYLVLSSLSKELQEKFDSGEYKIRDLDRIKSGVLPDKKIQVSNSDIHYNKISSNLGEKLKTEVIVKSNYIKISIKNEEEMNALLEKFDSLIIE